MLESEMRKMLIKDLPRVFFQPIESHGTVGIPDLFFLNTTNSMAGWAELKEIDDFRDEVRIPWRPGQHRWMQQYVRNGGVGILLCTSKHTDHWYAFFCGNILRSYTLFDIEDYARWSGKWPEMDIFDW